MASAAQPTLHAIARGAVEATGASHAWLLAASDSGLRVVAADGDDAARLVGETFPLTTGSVGYVASSGQPLALQPQAGRDDPWTEPHPLLDRIPTTICAVPCEGSAGLVGVLEVVDKAAGPFTFDDVEVVTLLGAIAGAALDDGADQTAEEMADPDAIAAELATLRATDPAQYRQVTRLIEALLANV
jgi:GAF domain-containing protein